MEYVETAGTGECFLCEDVVTADLAANYILVRTDLCLVVMNRYPYNTGHLLVSPLRHVGSLEELSDGERLEVMELTIKAIGALKEAMNPDGFNLGANLGAAAGAGLPGHLHIHLVPRWSGDTNFMPVTGDSKVLPETLDQTYARLQPLL